MIQLYFLIIRTQSSEKNLQFRHLPRLGSSHQPQLDSAVTRRSVFSTHSGTFRVRVNLLHRPPESAPCERVRIRNPQFPKRNTIRVKLLPLRKALLQKLAFLSPLRFATQSKHPLNVWGKCIACCCGDRHRHRLTLREGEKSLLLLECVVWC